MAMQGKERTLVKAVEEVKTVNDEKAKCCQ
jgi:hypothetical protein